MALIDESREAFRELRDVMPSAIQFNGIQKIGISHSISFKRAQHVANYQIDASSEFELEDTDFVEFVKMGLKDRVSEVQIAEKQLPDGKWEFGPPMVYLTKDTHPNSATVHLFLGSSN